MVRDTSRSKLVRILSLLLVGDIVGLTGLAVLFKFGALDGIIMSAQSSLLDRGLSLGVSSVIITATLILCAVVASTLVLYAVLRGVMTS